MDQTSKAVTTGVIVYRIITVANLALTFALFISGSGGSLTRTVVFMAWLALGVYSLIHMLSDVLSGQHKKSAEFSKHHRPLGAEHGRSRNRHAVFYPDAGRLLPPQAGGPRGPLGALSLTRRPRAAARGLHFDAAGSEWGPFFFPHLCPLLK